VKNIYNVLNERGYIFQATHLEKIKNQINGNPITFYLGIDPTADSLHIGHFFALMMFRYLQDAGHKGILVIGGATALVGDPSGKSEMRTMLSKNEVAYNIEEVKNLAMRFIRTNGENPAIILNNADWINSYSFIDFLRDIGIHFNINRMLAAETYSSRLEEGGLTFLEMGYMLMQSYDFVYLKNNFNCVLQIGGSDQWGNIVAGINLNRKLNNIIEELHNDEKEIYGLTCPLLMTKEGIKMGKSEKGTLWVAREKTTPFDFYQYFYNVKDEDVEKLLKLFTRVPLDEISYLCNTNIIESKRKMAYEITKLVHGVEAADSVVCAVTTLFGDNSNFSDVPTITINNPFVFSKINIIDFLVTTNFLSSKSEAKRMVSQGAISINNNKVLNDTFMVSMDNVINNHIILKKGKKTFLRVVIQIT